jgi:hypothetical protein
MIFPFHQEHLITAALWSAPAERSGDGAFVHSNAPTLQRFNISYA